MRGADDMDHISPTAHPTDGLVFDLLGSDAELADAVPARDRPAAREALMVRGLRADRGATMAWREPDAFCLLLLTGALWREVVAGRATSLQLLGPGAALLAEPAPGELLAPVTRVVALAPVRLAILDRRFLHAATRWPGLAAVLHRRLAEQERDVGALAAIAQLSKVDDRVLLVLWHLAERWGRRAPDGIVVPLQLTHATLGRLVGARRPTVSLALTALRERGLLGRDEDGHWLLLGDPPAAAHAAVAAPAPTAPELFGRLAGATPDEA